MSETSFRGEVGKALEVLAEGLAPFVDRRMRSHLHGADWIPAAASRMGKSSEAAVSSSDPQFQLDVLQRYWGPAFSSVLDERFRAVVSDLRILRNQWAHFDEANPVDIEAARRTYDLVEDLLRGIGSDEADLVPALLTSLEVRAARQGTGTVEGTTEALAAELRELRMQRSRLEDELKRSDQQARVVGNQAKAVSRQLAELQTQYAAVSGLRQRYDDLRTALEDGQFGPVDTGEFQGDLVGAVQELARESERLRADLDATRKAMEDLDPIQTPAGRRLLYLLTSMIVVMLVSIVLIVTQLA